jgi:hypothetical protein
VFSLIRSAGYINLFRIGKMNYRQSAIRWGEFGRECERLCIEHGRKYALKADLLKEINKISGGLRNG